MGHKVNRPSLVIGILATICLGFLMSCAGHSGKRLKPCVYRFQALTFSGMDAGATQWHLDIAVANPNKRSVTIARVHYAILHDADTLLTGWNPAQREVAATDSQIIQTTLAIPNTLWKRLPADIWSKTDAAFLITADTYLDTWLGPIEAPGALRETIHINMPEQMAKYREMIMQKLFSWPGQKVEQGPEPAP